MGSDYDETIRDIDRLVQSIEDDPLDGLRGLLSEFAQQGPKDETLFDALLLVYHADKETAFRLVSNLKHREPQNPYWGYLGALLDRYECRPPSQWRDSFHLGFLTTKRGRSVFPEGQEWTEGLPLPAELVVYGDEGIGDQIRRLWVMDQLRGHHRVTLILSHKITPLIGSLPDSWVLLSDKEYQNNPEQLNAPVISLGDLEALFWTKDGILQAYNLFDPACQKIDQKESGQNLRVGVCFRSALASQARDLHYMQVEDLVPILSCSAINPVLLQPTLDQQEEMTIRQYSYNPPEIVPHDVLFNDLKTLAQILRTLNFVISPSSYIADLAAAVGVETIRFQTGAKSSSEEKINPWYSPRTRYFYRHNQTSWDTIQVQIMEYMNLQL